VRDIVAAMAKIEAAYGAAVPQPAEAVAAARL
jgi:hypothetical protein